LVDKGNNNCEFDLTEKLSGDQSIAFLSGFICKTMFVTADLKDPAKERNKEVEKTDCHHD
jgi:hypothetical protein